MPNISITSDGTKIGTKVTVDGKQIDNLSSLHLYLDSYDSNIGFGYSVKELDKESRMEVRTHYSFDPSMASVIKVDESEEDRVLAYADFASM